MCETNTILISSSSVSSSSSSFSATELFVFLAPFVLFLAPNSRRLGCGRPRCGRRGGRACSRRCARCVRSRPFAWSRPRRSLARTARPRCTRSRRRFPCTSSTMRGLGRRATTTAGPPRTVSGTTRSCLTGTSAKPASTAAAHCTSHPRTLRPPFSPRAASTAAWTGRPSAAKCKRSPTPR